MRQERLVIEKRTPDGCELVSQWANTPRGWLFLSSELESLAKNGDGVYVLRLANSSDNLRDVPSILHHPVD